MYNYYIEMDLKYYMNIITNLSIIITFIFSIILIVDELYNIGFFSFKYTYLYNYGSSISTFNNVQSIECESNRYNVYSNNLYLYKDIFSKSYFNYLLIIAITLITILFTLAYGINFYFTFILNQPEVCSFYKTTSFIKTILKCLCDSCHEFIPNCTGNYFISFIILIIIPISYVLKSFLNIDITPNSNSTLYSFGYIILYIILIFTYSFVLFNIDKTDNNTNERLINVSIYLVFTFLFIISFYIYKYIYNKYTNITLININNDETFYDIYKQTPPNKPRPVKKPLFKGREFSFKYDPKSTEPDYKYKKELMDDYYKAIDNYENDLKYYAQKYNIYKTSNANLGDKTFIISMIINILGLNNRIHLFIIGLLILLSVIYYFYNNDLLFVCIIYLISIITIMTIMNSILYYNTILNKYIVYEPLSYYKYDIATANTKLNLILDPSNGTEFFDILNNNQKQKQNSISENSKSINDSIKDITSLTIYDNFNLTNIFNINNNIKIFTSDNNAVKIPNNNYDIYYIADSRESSSVAYTSTFVPDNGNGNANILYTKLILDKIDSFHNIIYNDKNITIDTLYDTYIFYPITEINLEYNYNEKISIIINKYNTFIYYYTYSLYKLLIKLKNNYNSIRTDTNANIDIGKKLDKLITIYNRIYNNYEKYKNNDIDTLLKREIDIDINSITRVTNITDLGVKITEDEITIFINFIINNIYTINKDLISHIDTKIKNATFNSVAAAAGATSGTILYFLFKFDINSNNITITQTSAGVRKILSYKSSEYYKYSILTANEFYNKSNYITQYDNKKTDISKLWKQYDDNKKLCVLLPSKIIDNNNNIYSIESVADTPLYAIQINNNYIRNNSNLDVISSYNSSNIYKFVNESPDSITYKQKSDGSYTPKTTFYTPYEIIYSYGNSVDSSAENLKKIILSSLIYNLTHITSKYELLDLKKILYFINPNSGTKIDKIERVDYTSLFNIINLTTPAYITSNFFIKTTAASSPNNGDYAVVLYNSYMYDKNNIIDIQEYLIYNKANYNHYNTDIYLKEKINNIKTQIDKNVEKTKLIKLYEENKYTINLILAIYDNLIKYIKNKIETKIDSTLCHPTITSKKQIETLIYNHLFNKFKADTSENRTSFNSITLNANYKQDITDLGNVITNIFNIILFLLNNIKVTNDETIKTDIINNFKFYNTDETINNTELSNIRKDLYIDCDYYNKYSNMDKKTKNYMKINADNVSYSFPVLLVIFIAIFCEPIFIKS